MKLLLMISFLKTFFKLEQGGGGKEVAFDIYKAINYNILLLLLLLLLYFLII